jgi:glycosyltransferase involved in cell wall biosynthesis
MKIVFLIRTLTYGGAERQLVALARGMHARGHEVSVAVFYPGGPLEADLEADGIPVLGTAKRGRWDLPGFFWQLGRLLRSEHPDIVHGYLGTSNVLSLLFKPLHRGKSVWGMRASDIPPERYEWAHRVEAKYERFLSRFPDLAIANSHAGRAHAIGLGYPGDKIIVIPNGIDIDRFTPDPEARTRVRAELGIAEHERLIGRVGRIDPQKDYSTFFRAMATVAQQRPNARFICVGTGPDDQTALLEAEAAELGLDGKLIWGGARGDMPALYNAFDLNISSSAYGEGTPNVVAEAMASGVPCVVTDVGDSAVTVGQFGTIVPRGDAAWLAAATVRTLDRIEAGEIDRRALREHIVANFSMTSLLDRTESALNRLLTTRSTRAVRDAREASAR